MKWFLEPRGVGLFVEQLPPEGVASSAGGVAQGDDHVGDAAKVDQVAGLGPVLVHKDSIVHYDHRLTARLEQIAWEEGIPIQHAVFGSFGSDGAALMQADIPAALVAFPARYTHTPFETGHLGDIEALTEWMCALVRESRR